MDMKASSYIDDVHILKKLSAKINNREKLSMADLIAIDCLVIEKITRLEAPKRTGPKGKRLSTLEKNIAIYERYKELNPHDHTGGYESAIQQIVVEFNLGGRSKGNAKYKDQNFKGKSSADKAIRAAKEFEREFDQRLAKYLNIDMIKE